jgi:hypothetical protein
MAFEGQDRIVAHHAGAVIGNFQEPAAACFHVNYDMSRTGVNSILDEFFGNRRWPFDNFARGNLVGNMVWQNAND